MKAKVLPDVTNWVSHMAAVCPVEVYPVPTIFKGLASDRRLSILCPTYQLGNVKSNFILERERVS
jgi:hypothetical protein